MLHHANKIIILLTLLLIFSCKNDEIKIKEQRELFYNTSISMINSNQYYKVYTMFNDSIKSWVNNNLANYKGLQIFKWQVDSLIVFNHTKNKCFMALLIQCTWPDCQTDEITYMYGVKIKSEWYFFEGGGTLVLPRKYYQKNIHVPLSFEKMKQIAIKEIFYRYLKKGNNGSWEINDIFFSDFVSGAWCTECTTQVEWDSVYLRQVRLNWVKRDYTEYDVK